MDDGSLRGDQTATRAWRQADDPDSGPVGVAPGAHQLRAGQPPGGIHPGAGPLVERGHVGPPPRVQAGVSAGADIGGPGVHSLLEGSVSVGHGVDSAVAVVPGDRGGHVAVAQLGQRVAFSRIVLAAVLAQLVDDVGVAAD